MKALSTLSTMSQNMQRRLLIWIHCGSDLTLRLTGAHESILISSNVIARPVQPLVRPCHTNTLFASLPLYPVSLLLTPFLALRWWPYVLRLPANGPLASSIHP